MKKIILAAAIAIAAGLSASAVETQAMTNGATPNCPLHWTRSAAMSDNQSSNNDPVAVPPPDCIE